MQRRELPRRSYRIDTPLGPVDVKEVTTPSGKRRLKIEYECIRRISMSTGHSLRQTELELAAFVNSARDS